MNLSINVNKLIGFPAQYQLLSNLKYTRTVSRKAIMNIWQIVTSKAHWQGLSLLAIFCVWCRNLFNSHLPIFQAVVTDAMPARTGHTTPPNHTSTSFLSDYSNDTCYKLTTFDYRPFRLTATGEIVVDSLNSQNNNGKWSIDLPKEAPITLMTTTLFHLVTWFHWIISLFIYLFFHSYLYFDVQ